MKLHHSPPVHLMYIPEAEAINQALLDGFDRELNGEHTHQSHFELGRFENTYIERTAIPEMEKLIDIALEAARKILGKNALKVGFWFNAMQPGQRTLRHNHDEDDELLSCVYYVSAPEESGDLIVHHADGSLRVKPEVGKFVFFSPRLAHEVEENHSNQRRLSIAFNFGETNAGIND